MATLLALSVLPATSADAFVTTVETDNGTEWQIHDASPPGLDTGSIRTVSQSSLEGFANIIVRVDSDPEPRLNGAMMRGFGVQLAEAGTFESTRSVDLGGLAMTRGIKVDDDGNWSRFFDTFTNTTGDPIEVDVSFGGVLGYGTGDDQGRVLTTSSGDTSITPDDAWSVVATADEDVRPIGVVIGTPGQDLGLSSMGNHELDPFEVPYATSGHASNFYGYVNSMTVAPGETRSLARFVHVGEPGAAATEPVTSLLDGLATAPDLTGLSTAEICSIDNWDVAAVPGFDADACGDTPTLDLPPVAATPATVTSSPYDVVDRTIEQLQDDMESGVTTSEEITQAYLDRITAYDTGPFAFNAFLHVADDAIEQARAADAARASGATGELLGVPLAMKDLFDTFDMPTTFGTRALEGWQPETDATQVAGLRDAGAVIIGKANLSEFARSGGYSESGWKQTWNALYPSKTSFGSSGGSSVSVAASMAAGALGSQTGVSLYAPAVGASLSTFRGTDGMASLAGVMPLSWAQDYGGPIARTTTDLAYLLNATTGTDPLDILTEEADDRRPDDWTAQLSADALEGKRVGFVPDAFGPGWAADGTGEALVDGFADIEAAGAEMVEMEAVPSFGGSPSGNRNMEGWARYIELHDDFPFPDGNAINASPLVLPYNTRDLATTPRMTPEQVDAWLAYRAEAKSTVSEWMDASDVDVVVYPGFRSDMGSNDSSNFQGSSDRSSGIPVSSAGVPTVTLPVGTNPNGFSMSVQLLGRAWDDAEVLAMGYALEQEVQGQQLSTIAPPLEYVEAPDPEPEPDAEVCDGHDGGPSFPDAPGSGHQRFIECLAALGVVQGKADGTFAPAEDVSRGQLASFVARAIETSTGESLPTGGVTFPDLGANSTHGPSVAKLAEAGILRGYADGTFRGGDPVSRDQTARYVVGALEFVLDAPLERSGASFADVAAGSQYSSDIDALVTAGVASGFTDGTFRPRSAVTRGQMASFIGRSLETLAAEGVYEGP